jgi:thiamine-monophosphate kinase
MAETDPMIGEEALIEAYFAPLASQAGAFGLKDDCAAFTPEPGQDLVLTTDAVAEGVHFLPRDRPQDIAWKALAVNVSDLAAKGAKPVGYLLSLSLPGLPDRGWLEPFTEGLKGAQDAFGIALFGGDTDRRSNAPLSVTIMAFGTVPSGRMVRRGTAQAGDLLYVSGTLGDAALGLQLRSGRVRQQERMAEQEWLEGRYLRPQPRTALRDALLSYAHAAMDISDGLAKDLDRLARASGLGAEIDADQVPVSKAAGMVLSQDSELRIIALTGGDDYEILAAVPPSDAGTFEAAAVSAGVPVAPIGRLVTGSGVVVRDAGGAALDVARSGYDHFRS